MRVGVCPVCKKEFTISRQRIYCSAECCMERNRKKQRKYFRKNAEKLGKRRLKDRFRILKRDNFTCQYCGRKAPEVILEIDHRRPKAKGGGDKIKNYITACRECNVGKGDVLL